MILNDAHPVKWLLHLCMAGTLAAPGVAQTRQCAPAHDATGARTDFLPRIESVGEYQRLLKPFGTRNLTLVKFTIDRGPVPSPQRAAVAMVYFQNTTAHGYHSPFAARYIPEFRGRRINDVDAEVARGAGRRFITGTIFYRPCALTARFPGARGFVAFDLSRPQPATAAAVASAYHSLRSVVRLAEGRLVYACGDECATISAQLTQLGIPWDASQRLFQ